MWIFYADMPAYHEPNATGIALACLIAASVCWGLFLKCAAKEKNENR